MSFKRFSRDRGAIVPFVALALPVLVLATAFAVDLGMQRSDRRSMQAAADVISLDMARVIDERTLQELEDASAEIQAALTRSAERNGLANATVTAMSGPRVTLLEWGILNTATGEFEALDPSDPADLAIVPDAVRVVTQDETDYKFRPGEGPVTRDAVARAGGLPTTTPTTPTTAVLPGTPVGGFTVGSRLASVSTAESRLLNGVLNGLLPGSAVTIDAAAYDNLVGAYVTISELLEVFARAGTVDELLSTSVTVSELVDAMVSVLSQRGAGGDLVAADAATVLGSLAAELDGNVRLVLGDLISVAVGAEDAVANAGLDVFGLLTAAIFAANGDSFIDIPSVTADLPGELTALRLRLRVIEGPRWVFGPVGTQVSTAQVALEVIASVDIPIAGIGSLTGQVPLVLTAAAATGTLAEVGCGQVPAVTLDVSNQLLATSVGSTTTPLNLEVRAGVPILQVEGATVPIQTQQGGTHVTIAQPDFLPEVGTGSMAEVPPAGLGAGSLLSPGALRALDVEVLGVLPLDGLGSVLAAMVAALNPVLGALEAQIVAPLTKALGIELGSADVGGLGIICPPEQAVLVD